jgi:RNA polymerase sigma-32 factor
MPRRKSSSGGKNRLVEPEVIPREREEQETESDGELDDEAIEVEASNASHLPVEPSHFEPDLGPAISPTDPLRRYLEELKRYPLLEPEEEFRLAVRLKETGDMDAARRLVAANLRLVVKIAFEYRSYYTNLLDLIQEGNVGLMKAVSKFDPTKGARLGYYASWWIRSYILKYLLDNFRLVKIGTTQAQKKLFYHLMREKERLEAQGLLAGPKLLAERLDVREKDVVEMEQRLSGRGAEVSLDAPVDPGGETGASHMDFIADDAEPADERLARAQLLKLLEGKLPAFKKLLGEKELRILSDRLLADAPKTLQEVADLYGLTRERARQIEAKVIQRLRDFLGSTIK